MKNKYSEWYWNWAGANIALVLVFIISYLPIPWVYAKPLMDSLILTFALWSLICGAIFMVYRIKYLKELEHKS